jgi:hypothetical protein
VGRTMLAVALTGLSMEETEGNRACGLVQVKCRRWRGDRKVADI